MKWIFILSVICTTHIAFSEEVESQVSTPLPTSSPDAPLTTEPTVAQQEPIVVLVNKSSMENRKNLKYQLTLGFIGREYVAAPLTFSLGYYLSPEDLILLRYSNYNGSYESKVSRTLRATTVGYRRFFGNSFNFMASAYYRRNTSDYYREGSFYLIGPSNLIYEDIGVGIRVGNEWQWENFTMGCDWFGINHSLIKITKKEESRGVIDTLGLEKSLTFTLLSFYLGYSF